MGVQLRKRRHVQTNISSISKKIFRTENVKRSPTPLVKLKRCTLSSTNAMQLVGENAGKHVNQIHLSEPDDKSTNKTDAAVISTDNRVLPTRQCKNCTVSAWVPRKRKRITERTSRPKFKKSKWRKPTPLEAIQLQEKLNQAVLNAAQAQRRPCLRILTRTVEMVNQTTEQWREERSKLLFIVGLGLTPIPNSPVLPSPYVKLVRTSLEEIKRIQKESEEIRAENALKIARRKERVQRFERIRSWRLTLVDRVEVIDLTASDDNESKVEMTTTAKVLQKKEPYYCNLTKEITPTLHAQQLQSQTSEKLANKISCPTNFTDRTLTISSTMNIIHDDSPTRTFLSK